MLIAVMFEPIFHSLQPLSEAIDVAVGEMFKISLKDEVPLLVLRCSRVRWDARSLGVIVEVR